MRIKGRRGFTITEVLVASLLLAMAMVPCLKAMTSAHMLGTTIERKSRALAFAKAKIEDIRARSIYSYSSSFSTVSSQMSGPYYCKVSDNAVSGTLREIKVSAGYDGDGNGSLGNSEVLVTLETLIAKRW